MSVAAVIQEQKREIPQLPLHSLAQDKKKRQNFFDRCKTCFDLEVETL